MYINQDLVKIWRERYVTLSPETKAFIEYAAEIFIEEIEKKHGIKRPYQLDLFKSLEEVFMANCSVTARAA